MMLAMIDYSTQSNTLRLKLQHMQTYGGEQTGWAGGVSGWGVRAGVGWKRVDGGLARLWFCGRATGGSEDTVTFLAVDMKYINRCRHVSQVQLILDRYT